MHGYIGSQGDQLIKQVFIEASLTSKTTVLKCLHTLWYRSPISVEPSSPASYSLF